MNDSTSQPVAAATYWQLRSRRIDFGRLPCLMGIVNVTPDSFSDGGKFFDPTAAVDHGLALVAAGAEILDIGGQSTRPGSESVTIDEELRRVMPVVSALCQQTDVPVSIDTDKATVARETLDAGAEIVNDVTALTGDPEMLSLVAERDCGVCLMHMQGTPRTMQQQPRYKDVVADVTNWLARRRDAAMATGIARERIALDPGIGFGKTTEHNLELMRNAWRFHSLGCPVLVGPSRKRFIAEVLQDAEADRTFGTVAVALSLAQQGVQILRVHDLVAVRQALTLFTAVERAAE